MIDEKKENEGLVKESYNSSEEIIFEETEIIEEKIEVENEDSLNVNISLEDVEELTENEASIVGQKIEVLIDRYEDLLLKAENENLKEDELIQLGFDEDEYYRLKNLDKHIYAHIHKLHKKTKENGFIASIPMWAFILFIICAIFTIVPVNPYLPITIYSNFYAAFNSEFMTGVGGAYVFYFAYIGIFFITEFVSLLILYKKGKVEKEKKAAFKSCLILFILNVIINIPSLVIFLDSAIGYNA